MSFSLCLTGLYSRGHSRLAVVPWVFHRGICGIADVRWGRMPFLSLNQQCRSTEGMLVKSCIVCLGQGTDICKYNSLHSVKNTCEFHVVITVSSQWSDNGFASKYLSRLNWWRWWELCRLHRSPSGMEMDVVEIPSPHGYKQMLSDSCGDVKEMWKWRDIFPWCCYCSLESHDGVK